MELQKLVLELSSAPGVSGLDGALKVAEKYLSMYTDVVKIENGSLFGLIKGDSDYTVLLDAHIDEIGMIVTYIDENGFVKAAKAGCIDVRSLAAQQVTIWGNNPIQGVFCSTPPHLSKPDNDVPDIADVYIDTGLGDKAKELIPLGSRITFKQYPKALINGRLSGKSLDNRAGVAAILETAKRLKSYKSIPCDIAILLSDQEELGCRGAKTAAFDICPNEAIVVDVSFGDLPDVPSHKTGKLGEGTMIGISPVLSQSIIRKLKSVSKTNELPSQIEVMGGDTSTNADVISITKTGIPCGLLSIPLRNMHSTVEVIDLNDITNTAELLTSYITSCGIRNEVL